MLWVNLIMDTLGAIALGTEPYKKTGDAPGAVSRRISRRDRIMLPEMWRQVVGQAIYQILVMIVLMYFGGLIFFEESFNLISGELRDPDTQKAAPRLVLDTICFHTFILMNLFNQINSRVVDANDINVFRTLLNNGLFWLVLAFEIAVQ